MGILIMFDCIVYLWDIMLGKVRIFLQGEGYLEDVIDLFVFSFIQGKINKKFLKVGYKKRE